MTASGKNNILGKLPVLKTVLSTFLIILIIPSFLWAGGRDSSENSPHGKWCVEFQMDHFQIQPFHGAMLSIKYDAFEQTAFRVGVGIDGNLSNKEIGDQVTGYAMVLHNSRMTSSTRLYYGGGAMIGFSLKETSEDDGTFDEFSSWNLGLEGTMGIEWFAASSLSFTVEYSLALLETHNVEYTRVPEPWPGFPRELWFDNYRRLDLSSPGVRVGISAYF